MVGDAGDLERLNAAVKNSAESAADSEKYQWETFARNYSGSIGSKFPTLMAPRSAEPHIAFARELGFLEHRSDGGRWLVTMGSGRAFLRLWGDDQHRPPTYFLLSHLLRYDRTLLLPFLRLLLQERIDPPLAIAKTWEQMWKKYRNDMARLEPPVPLTMWHDDGRSLKRTAKHHSDARLRLLTKKEGLGLANDRIVRLVDEFWDFKDTKLPSDSYFRIGFAMEGKKAEPISEETMRKWISLTVSRLQRGTFISAIAAFDYTNEMLLPREAVEWDTFSVFIRSSDLFVIHPSVRPGDFLFGISAQKVIDSTSTQTASKVKTIG